MDWKTRNSDLFAKAVACCQAGNLNEAGALCRNILSSDPGHSEAMALLGTIQLQAGNRNEGLALTRLSLEMNPHQPGVLNFLGITLYRLKQHKEALACFDRAIALSPGEAELHNNRGNVLNELKRHDEALASYDRAIALNPRYATTHSNKGFVLTSLGRHSEALASYDRAIAIEPGHVEANLNKGYLKILLGEFGEGWKLHEWRWQHDDAKSHSRKFLQPLWLGQESLAHKTILLHSEQGLGDTIQFCRYVTMVEGMGAKVVLEAQRELVPLLSTLGESIHVIPVGGPLPEFDCHCPLMSLPLAFRTTVDTIPAKIPYLGTSLDKLKQWQARLGAKTRPRIGLAWSGKKERLNVHARSIPLPMLAPLLDLDLEFHCLQKEIQPADREFLARWPRIRLHNSGLNDFADTAALLSEMNLVISVDTSVAHLAGALGKAVWILLSFAADYRWMAGRDDSPWYPTARLYRQPEFGEWNSVVMKIAADLKLFLRL